MGKNKTFPARKQEDGVWSGRGIGVPVAGAIFGGDDYKEKIGRGKKPYYHGNTGTPSQGADSTFSSFLARVNRDYPEYELPAMFPEQEEVDDNIYDSDEVHLSPTRKLPRDFKVKRPTVAGISERMTFDENTIVKNSRYSLLDVERKRRIDEGMVSQLFGDLIGDLGAAALATAFGGTTSWAFVALNISQLNRDMQKSAVAIEVHLRQPTDATAKELADVLDSMSINLIDLFQRLLEAIPDPSPAGEAVSFLSSIINNVKKLSAFLKTKLSFTGLTTAPGATLSRSQQVWSKVKVVALVTPIMRFFVRILDSDYAPESFRENSGLLLSIPKRMILLSDLIEDYEIQKEVAAEIGSDFTYRRRMTIPSDYNAYDHNSFERYTPSSPQGAPPPSPATVDNRSWQQQPGSFTDPAAAYSYIQGLRPGSLSLEEKNMSNTLRQFIREAVSSVIEETAYPDYPSMQPPNPRGYNFRSVPVIHPDSEQEDKFKTLDNYDDFSVSYTADGGVVNYQARNKQSLEEVALRRIIRSGIREALSESKKKD